MTIMKVPSLTSMLLDNNGGRRKQRRTLSSSRLFQEDEDSTAASTLTRCTSYSTLDSTSPVVTSSSCAPPSPVPLVLLHPPIDVASPADEVDAVDVDIQKKNLNVSFGHVSVRRYFMILGDHPSCPTGVPISIGWEYEPLPIEPTVDEYESIRQSRRRTNIKQLSMNMYQRRGILNRTAATTTTKESIADNSVVEEDDHDDIEKSIKVAMKQVKRIQKQRQITRLQSRIPFYNKLEEVLESTKRKISKKKA